MQGERRILAVCVVGLMLSAAITPVQADFFEWLRSLSFGGGVSTGQGSAGGSSSNYYNTGPAAYYIDPVNGSDSELGISPELAWRSLGNVASRTRSGDTVVILQFQESLADQEWPERIYRSASVGQFGIAWSFDQERRIGRFANGDFWVIGPVTIVGISPASAEQDGRTRNGSMVDPAPGWGSQGYDSAVLHYDYDASLNVALEVSPEHPLALPGPCSLVSTRSVMEGGVIPQIRTAAILTVLETPAPPGSFRPGYSDSDKTIRHNASELDYALLQNLPAVAETPSLEAMARAFERPWLDHRAGWIGREHHPVDNMPDYGREMATRIGQGALVLHLDFPMEEKAKLLHSYVQLGIDLYAIVVNGGNRNWHNDGGHAGGRKWPILFAGLMLNDDGMKSIGAKSGEYLYQAGYGPGNRPPDYIHFGEDDQTFYVTQADVDITNSAKFKPDSRDSQKIPYTVDDIGLPEWGIRHATHPQYCNKWLPTKYRSVAGPPFNGLALPALLMNAKELWNHDAFFDYTDRYMAFSAPGGEYAGYWRSMSPFTANMWDAYRAQCGPIWSGIETGPDPEPDPPDGGDPGDGGDPDPPEPDPVVDEPPTVELLEPQDGQVVSGAILFRIEATDAEDAPGELVVEVGIDYAVWLDAPYNPSNGFYEVEWDSADLGDGQQHIIIASATDHASEQNTTTTDPISVIIQPAQTMHVASVTLFQAYTSFMGRSTQAAVTVVDNAGDPVIGAVVAGMFDGSAPMEATATTNWGGLAILAGPEGLAALSASTFTVTDVSHPDYAYRPDHNVVNSGSL